MSDEEKVPLGESSENGEAPLKISRRDFLVGAGAGVIVTGAAAAGIAAFRGPQIQEIITEIEVPVEVVREVQVGGEQQATEPVISAPGLPASLRAVTLDIDNKRYDLIVDVRESLWEVMVGSLNLGSVNMGCDRAQCGACAVTVNGRSVNGCTVLAARLGRGQKILTVAGISKGSREDQLHPIAKAYWKENSAQCGICTRGFIMSTYDLLSRNPNPSENDILEALAGNICRCSEYPNIYNAVVTAAEEMRAA
jgi:aerobic carbon-monoxide dehydrogenase small subunit